MATQITATLPTLAFPKEVDYPTQEDWTAFSAAAELNFGILGGSWSTQMQLWKTQANAMSTELNTNATDAQNARDEAVSAIAILASGSINDTTIAPNKAFSNQYINNNFVKLTGNETVSGVKTFNSSPIVPTPTAATQAANKAYVDSTIIDQIGLIDYGYVAKSYHIVAFGGEFNRADYPKLWAYIQLTPGVFATEAYWQMEAAANGGICGFFSAGNGTTTFRVPNLNNAFLRPTIRAVGSYQADAFKNHTHDIVAPTSIAAGAGSTGIILSSSGTPNFSTTPSGGTETRPINIAVLPLIVAK